MRRPNEKRRPIGCRLPSRRSSQRRCLHYAAPRIAGRRAGRRTILLAAGLRAGALRAAILLTGAFFIVLRVTGFFAATCFAGRFLAAGLRAGALRAVVFLAVVFFSGARRLVA